MDKNIYVTQSFLPPYEEYVEMIKPLWESHKLTNMGEYHKKLEKELVEYLNVSKISLMTNGHMALELALQAMNLSGEVITTPFTFVSTTHSIVRNGLKPVFCDINPIDYTIDVNRIEELITEKTTAILPVHVYGHVCNVEKIEDIAKKHGLAVLYDAAHAFGEEYKGRSVADFGDASILSFHATKVFHSIEGGAVVYHDEMLGKSLYGLKNFGIRDEFTIDAVGANAKMDEFRAIMGLCNLKYIDNQISKRKIVVEKYRELLEGVKGITISLEQPNVKSNYAYFPILVDKQLYGRNRDELYEELKKRGIFARKYFYPLITNTSCYREENECVNLAYANQISDQVITLPLYAELSLDQVEDICNMMYDLKR